MPFTLELNGQLLIGGDGTATVHLNNGSSLSVMSKNTSRFSREVPGIYSPEDTQFYITIDQLSDELQARIRADINHLQQQTHDKAPEYRTEYPSMGGLVPSFRYGEKKPEYRPSRRVPIEKPAASIVIPDSYKLVIPNHSIFNKHRCLQVGKRITLSPERPYDKLSYTLGNIARFTIP